ncbi:hypothetical protein AVEN_109658-1 [Araneus ventricosus]|uniref:Uncharacterized protein n=1 Tax=Araneus ventricosus TaxID=182803 RepID=A0A4Y2G046_ARAVE|nr:hypothetical protein AVEN_109658-1 [Araneus ventricosus]
MKSDGRNPLSEVRFGANHKSNSSRPHLLPRPKRHDGGLVSPLPPLMAETYFTGLLNSNGLSAGGRTRKRSSPIMQMKRRNLVVFIRLRSAQSTR